MKHFKSSLDITNDSAAAPKIMTPGPGADQLDESSFAQFTNFVKA